MKKIITLIGIISAVVFINPAQAKADVRAYVYLNPLAWFFTPPIRVVEKRVRQHRPIRERVVHVQPAKYKKVRHSYRQPRKVVKNKFNYNKKRYTNKKFKRHRKW